MPYYLVTQTSLVEGEDEVRAAQKVLAKLQSEGSTEFTVKFDAENIRRVRVANHLASELNQQIPYSPTQFVEALPEKITHGAPVLTQGEMRDPTQSNLSAKGIVFGLSLFGAGLITGLVADFLN
ncbi:hypothetical protein KX729_29105 [Rhizobium sp. XQZ8]|uniref:hypothetical protein n=1 Tax=Rhizobium populisoli TaxID=2859785 RepID=UPI001CA52A0E|nr:hypothetical protein [Rhizobium populisoli]MBW6425478.1 hypothetical protein [Rhizobium populisoli]